MDLIQSAGVLTSRQAEDTGTTEERLVRTWREDSPLRAPGRPGGPACQPHGLGLLACRAGRVERALYAACRLLWALWTRKREQDTNFRGNISVSQLAKNSANSVSQRQCALGINAQALPCGAATQGLQPFPWDPSQDPGSSQL